MRTRMLSPWIYGVALITAIAPTPPTPMSKAGWPTRGALAQTPSVPQTVEDVAIATLMRWNPVSYLVAHEFGGSICQNPLGKPFASGPAHGERGRVQPTVCPKGTTLAGRYHTHDDSGDEGPSSRDIENAKQLPGIPFYVGTPCGAIYTWIGSDQAKMVRPCGTTHKQQK